LIAKNHQVREIRESKVPSDLRAANRCGLSVLSATLLHPGLWLLGYLELVRTQIDGVIGSSSKEVTMSGERKSVRLFGENLDEGMHICTFVHTSAERYRVLMPFIREGMEQGDRAFHIVSPSLRSEHAQRIAEAGVDAARAEVEGQLENHRMGRGGSARRQF
jgi:hypothetical protein